MSQDRTPEQSSSRWWFVCITGNVYVDARSRDEALAKGRAALNGEVFADPHLELGVRDAWRADAPGLERCSS